MTQIPHIVFLVGGGIAALSAAALLIREGRVPGSHIHILEQSDRLGGSLDGSGCFETGYLIRGGRMFEEHFGCTFDLFNSIPTLTDAEKSVSTEILEFSRQVVTSSNCRLVNGGQKIEAPRFELVFREKQALARLLLCQESRLGTKTIEEFFAPRFFQTNFWIMWSTMFAFQPWHSVVEMRRYMRRFMHLLPGFNRLEGIIRTKLNQYDSLILPLSEWLRNQGVQFLMNSEVTDVDFELRDSHMTARTLQVHTQGKETRMEMGSGDFLFVTLGSMTECSSVGSLQEPPKLQQEDLSSWQLWKNIASRSPAFGNPDAFCSRVDRTQWESFTVTLPNHDFFKFMEAFTGNPAGTGGLVTFKDSSWRMSVVLAHQPHFINQPEEADVFWGYALFGDRTGDYVKKKMSECSGEEIITELAYHLRLQQRASELFAGANCIPCMMPFITSQFMPRKPGDRPEVVPTGADNFAFLGQFTEIPMDCVFTVEYSVRSAQRAVYSLLGRSQQETPLYRGDRNATVLWKAFSTLMW